jgi:adenylate cyclase 2
MLIINISIYRQVHITEATLSKLNNQFHVEPYLDSPIQTYLIVADEYHYQPQLADESLQPHSSCADLFVSALSVTSLIEQPSRRKNSNGSGRTASPKYTECCGADKPFANISENKLAKNISMAVRQHF